MDNSNQQDEISSGSEDEQLRKLNLKIKTAELHKLNLEIEESRRDNWAGRVTKYLSVITVLISVSGFLWGVIQYLNQQKKDNSIRELEQTIKLQNQIRTDHEQLLQFPSDENYTISKVLFILQDLDNLIDLLYPPEKYAAKNHEERRKITKTLIELSFKDCDFNQLRHVRFDVSALQNWKDYSEQLKLTPNDPNFIYKYFEAFRNLHSKNSKYIESITYDSQTGYMVDFYDPRFIQFRTLVDGFKLHLEFLQDPNQRKEAIGRFAEATNNPLLAADLFETVAESQ